MTKEDNNKFEFMVERERDWDASLRVSVETGKWTVTLPHYLKRLQP